MKSITELKSTCINTAEKLFEMYEEDGKNHLVFPYYRDKKEKRVSEQEARFIFSQELEKINKYYAVEVPTKYRYGGFSGKEKEPQVFYDDKNGFSDDKSGQSASIDLCIFDEIPNDNNPLPGRINVEFKAHNVEQNHITKDFLKLLAEDGDGLFFHLLESVDNNTLISVLEKYKTGINSIFTKPSIKLNDDNKEKSVMFFIISLNPKFIISKSITKKKVNNNKIFKIEYIINSKQGEIPRGIKINALNDWDFLRF